MVAVPLIEEEGEVVKWYGELQQRSMQEDRLRLLGQMASGIAHDINNALCPATLYSKRCWKTMRI